MTRLGAIEFDDRILDALRDDTLVVFAGAGVSMSSPSNLSSFWKLTCDIAEGTGLVPDEPLDRFLGQLHHRKVAVHERAAQLLSPAGSAPNALHRDLLRLFRATDCVRLVTTNFDLHFETASESLFGAIPVVYRAPALPLGYNFNGIVHVHGALPQVGELVLTDVDFGRAYLTEGWARRFLVDVFRRYTVLFVGYSHNDVVMNYLSRALPADGIAGRFALTEEDENWELLGIKPLHFNKGIGTEAYSELYDGVHRLAERATRGALDWQSRLAELCSRAPPADEEAVCEVEQALKEVYTTRFFINVTRDPEWIKWLNTRKQLDAVFGSSDLSEKDKLLAGWLAEHFAIEHAATIFEILASHDLRLNPVFWWLAGRELGLADNKFLQESTLRRWVTILLANVPAQADHHVLMWLANRCASQGLVELTVKVFIAMSKHRLRIKPSFVWAQEEDDGREGRLDAECSLETDHWPLNEIWINHLRPNLTSIAQPLLSGVTRRLEDIRSDLMAWDKASRVWDPVSFGRAAIEPHQQDEHPEAIDVLIDAARDALEAFVSDSPAKLDAWMDRLVTSDVPLLRRLAIHAVSLHPGKSADERLLWLGDRVGLHNHAEHHEIYSAFALNYAGTSEPTRRAAVEAVQAHILEASDDSSAEQRTARAHFEWLSWLIEIKPDCTFAGAPLALLKKQFPEWRPREHPDLTHWGGTAEWVGPQSPWSVEELLSREPREQIVDLQNFKGRRFDGPDREGLLAVAREACQQNTLWAFALSAVLAEQSLWSSDLWPVVIRGLQEADLTEDTWHELLTTLSKDELLATHAYDIAQVLYSIVRDGGKPFALEILEQANDIAMSQWQALEPNTEDISDWLSRAINRPAGVIVEFWINGLSLLMHGKAGAARALPDNYRQWLTMVVEDPTSNGGMGRSVIASQTAFLFGLDEGWTRTYIIPLFSDVDPQKFAQAWDGFLAWGRLYPALVEVLIPAFIGAMPRLDSDLSDRRRRFVELFTALTVFYASDPAQHLLPTLFESGSLNDRISFATHLGYFLRQMQPVAKRQLWDSWLHRYWQNRPQGLLAVLDEAEIQQMLAWLLHLGDAYPEGVSLATRSPAIQIRHHHLLFELRESELVLQFPSETAELLIYLCRCGVGFPAYLGEVAARLSGLSSELRQRLQEALALAGVVG